MDKDMKDLIIKLVEITLAQQQQINHLSVAVDVAAQRLDNAGKAKIFQGMQQVYYSDPAQVPSGTELLERLNQLLAELRKD